MHPCSFIPVWFRKIGTTIKMARALSELIDTILKDWVTMPKDTLRMTGHASSLKTLV